MGVSQLNIILQKIDLWRAVMTEEQVFSINHDPVADREIPSVVYKKKKASWFRTILWMLSMMMLTNVAMAIIAYVLYSHKLI